MHTISREPFARMTLVREVLCPLVGAQTCSWCGNIRTTRSSTPFLYRYGTEPDAIHARVSWHEGAFCSKSCHDVYHDVP
jgi:hypothetical protein